MSLSNVFARNVSAANRIHPVQSRLNDLQMNTMPQLTNENNSFQVTLPGDHEVDHLNQTKSWVKPTDVTATVTAVVQSHIRNGYRLFNDKSILNHLWFLGSDALMTQLMFLRLTTMYGTPVMLEGLNFASSDGRVYTLNEQPIEIERLARYVQDALQKHQPMIVFPIYVQICITESCKQTLNPKDANHVNMAVWRFRHQANHTVIHKIEYFDSIGQSSMMHVDHPFIERTFQSMFEWVKGHGSSAVHHDFEFVGVSSQPDLQSSHDSLIMLPLFAPHDGFCGVWSTLMAELVMRYPQWSLNEMLQVVDSAAAMPEFDLSKFDGFAEYAHLFPKDKQQKGMPLSFLMIDYLHQIGEEMEFVVHDTLANALPTAEVQPLQNAIMENITSQATVISADPFDSYYRPENGSDTTRKVGKIHVHLIPSFDNVTNLFSILSFCIHSNLVHSSQSHQPNTGHQHIHAAGRHPCSSSQHERTVIGIGRFASRRAASPGRGRAAHSHSDSLAAPRSTICGRRKNTQKQTPRRPTTAAAHFTSIKLHVSSSSPPLPLCKEAEPHLKCFGIGVVGISLQALYRHAVVNNNTIVDQRLCVHLIARKIDWFILRFKPSARGPIAHQRERPFPSIEVHRLTVFIQQTNVKSCERHRPRIGSQVSTQGGSGEGDACPPGDGLGGYGQHRQKITAVGQQGVFGPEAGGRAGLREEGGGGVHLGGGARLVVHGDPEARGRIIGESKRRHCGRGQILTQSDT
eukprot:scaffold288_cov143-Ochromonas_danica.AAC.10